MFTDDKKKLVLSQMLRHIQAAYMRIFTNEK